MKRKHTYLLVCLALVEHLCSPPWRWATRARGRAGTATARPCTTRTGTRRLHKRHHRRHRHHPRHQAAAEKLEGNVTAIDSGAKTITLALDDRGTNMNRTALVHVPDTSKFATGDNVELFVTGPAADGSFTLVAMDNRRDDVRQNDDGVNHDLNDDRGDDHGGDRHGGGDNSGPGRGGSDD